MKSGNIITWFLVGILVFGVYFTVFGLKLLFKQGFVEKLRKGIWKSGELSEKNFPGKSGYNYDKYGTGIYSLIMGLLALGFSIYALFFN
ncbi:MAG TPA: hypothetical protein VJA82_08480 [Sediminibacterium sp.]|uniref:DUF3899 domain-containing protein n=1 Tax=Candidatus Nomurabacteria bacterium RIFOXYC2_FULL_36_19 TaxID=1801806 RepID=A0A1F6YWW3_9BACT|nr:hypothetical protein [Sediminibacterium sp.]OGJ10825.1 MAG: hypothetical protein A2456_02250 [Candidatus Nomurabacteria bacterium RIFOXYC2_FULL_36_19]OGJ13624.1 MAG: hypothetical protein A2554_03765 [Candidatus Nomurabacteria bacterium RIFOXYD2_FULL_35_12]HLD53326.1 hypothetical protein [Sediminibacterium sp.]